MFLAGGGRWIGAGFCPGRQAMKLPKHIKKWWDIANVRRSRLIYKKHMGVGRKITQAQEAEFIMLQKVAEAVMEYISPIDLTPLEDKVKKAERLARRMKRIVWPP